MKMGNKRAYLKNIKEDLAKGDFNGAKSVYWYYKRFGGKRSWRDLVMAYTPKNIKKKYSYQYKSEIKQLSKRDKERLSKKLKGGK